MQSIKYNTISQSVNQSINQSYNTINHTIQLIQSINNKNLFLFTNSLFLVSFDWEKSDYTHVQKKQKSMEQLMEELKRKCSNINFLSKINN